MKKASRGTKLRMTKLYVRMYLQPQRREGHRKKLLEGLCLLFWLFYKASRS